jgi:hypothetical protein
MTHIKAFRAKRPALFGVLVGVALATASAALAFAIYSLTVGGQATSNFAANSNMDSITLSQNGSTPDLNRGGEVVMPILETNNDPANQHRILTLGATFTTKDSSNVDNSGACASHLSMTTSQGLVGAGVAAGGTNTGTVSVAADASTPDACGSGTWTIHFNGTTN